MIILVLSPFSPHFKENLLFWNLSEIWILKLVIELKGATCVTLEVPTRGERGSYRAKGRTLFGVVGKAMMNSRKTSFHYTAAEMGRGTLKLEVNSCSGANESARLLIRCGRR